MRRGPVVAAILTLAGILLVGAYVLSANGTVSSPRAVITAEDPPVVTTTTTTTVPPPPPTTPTTTTTTVATPVVAQAPTPPPPGYGCAAAIAYLQAHADPSFSLYCTDAPGARIEGGEAMTCNFNASFCPTSQFIYIADPCPAAYMNEASNSWVLTGQSDAPIDPYGVCPS